MDLDGIIQSHIDNFETQLNTTLPAEIVSFDSEAQTATVQPLIYEVYSDGISSRLPEIDDVPVMFPSAGGGMITFPIRAGDEVLLVFSQRDIDKWSVQGGESIPSTQHYHEYNDAIAIVGLSSNKNSLKANTDDVQIRFDDADGELCSITLGADKSISLDSSSGSQVKQLSDGNIEITTANTIKIKNNGEELVTILSEALQAIIDANVNTVYGVSPLNNKPDFVALKARLDTLKG